MILKLKSSRLSKMLVLSWPLSSSSRYKSKHDADEAVSVVSLTSSSGGYINGRNSASQLSTKIYDKRDDFNFKIINFPNMCSNIPASPAYGVYISQLIRYARASSNYSPYLYTFSLCENPSFIIFSAETEYISTRSWDRNINFLRDRKRRFFW
jgi:hypothetical protein